MNDNGNGNGNGNGFHRRGAEDAEVAENDTALGEGNDLCSPFQSAPAFLCVLCVLCASAVIRAVGLVWTGAAGG